MRLDLFNAMCFSCQATSPTVGMLDEKYDIVYVHLYYSSFLLKRCAPLTVLTDWVKRKRNYHCVCKLRFSSFSLSLTPFFSIFFYFSTTASTVDIVCNQFRIWLMIRCNLKAYFLIQQHWCSASSSLLYLWWVSITIAAHSFVGYNLITFG